MSGDRASFKNPQGKASPGEDLLEIVHLFLPHEEIYKNWSSEQLVAEFFSRRKNHCVVWKTPWMLTEGKETLHCQRWEEEVEKRGRRRDRSGDGSDGPVGLWGCNWSEFSYELHLNPCLSLSELSWWLRGKESPCQCRRLRRRRFDLWVGKIPWRRKWQPTPVLLPRTSNA